jgi:hypothetical protein
VAISRNELSEVFDVSGVVGAGYGGAAFALVLFILLVIILRTGFGVY